MLHKTDRCIVHQVNELECITDELLLIFIVKHLFQTSHIAVTSSKSSSVRVEGEDDPRNTALVFPLNGFVIYTRIARMVQTSCLARVPTSLMIILRMT